MRLCPIVPHLIIVALSPPDDFDIAAGRALRRGGARRCRSRPANDPLRSGGARRVDRPLLISRRAVYSGPKVAEADGLDERAVLFLARLSQHQAQAADFLRERELLGAERIDFQGRALGDLRLALGASGILPDSDDANVLKKHVGDLVTAALPGDQHVN